MDSGVVIVFILATVLVLGGALLLFIFYKSGDGIQLNVEKYRSQWLKIDGSIVEGSPMTYQMAILNADKLLDSALKEARYSGNTMGERLKAADKTFSNVNAVWAAHKLRNRIAHEPDVTIRYDTARRAMAAFKQALKDIGAI